MRAFVKLLVLAIAALALPAMTVAPAQAAAPTLTFPDGVIYADTCSEHVYSHQIPADPAVDVFVQLHLYSPDGLEADFDYQTDRDGRGDFAFCDGALPGTYTVTGEISFCRGDVCSDNQVQGAFKMRPAYSLTHIRTRSTARAGSVVRVLVKVQDERPNGYYPSDSATAYLEQQKGKRWIRMKRSKVDVVNGRGIATFPMPRSRIKIRAIQTGAVGEIKPDGEVIPSTSIGLSIKPT